jgi:RimJ/RimL family protein N-acetyltransferase
MVAVTENEAIVTVTLREIQEHDTGLLVRWRNENAQWFPAGETLTTESHLAWYHTSYLTDPSQNLYMVLADGREVGTVGMNISDACGELSRMILGDKTVARRGIMRQGMRQLLDAYGLSYYWGRVLPSNQAVIAFHKTNGFRVIGVHGGWFTDIYGVRGEFVLVARYGEYWDQIT